jgi:DNA transformation protein
VAVSQSCLDFLLDLFRPLDPAARRMFGGVGLFHDGVMFGLVTRDILHFRVDDTTRGRFESTGSEPFRYMRAGREVTLGAYYVVPEDLLDRPDELLAWGREAIVAARKMQRRK